MTIEKIKIPETKSVELFELINTKSLPESSFQSYEKFKNDASEKKEAFLANEVINPNFEYFNFSDISDLDKGIDRLSEVIKKVESLDVKPIYKDATRSSLNFRCAEMEYVKLLARLDADIKLGKDEKDFIEIAEKARTLNEHLYGSVDNELLDAALNEFFIQIDGKLLSNSAYKIYSELNNGFKWKDKEILPLKRPKNSKLRLPSFEAESLAWAGEHIIEKNAHIETILSDFWHSKVEEYGDNYTCSPSDIAEAFEHVLRLMDPNDESGVNIIMDPNALSLSWSSAEMAVKIGEKRKSITSADELFRKVLHELIVHGGRTINGLKTELPILGMGLFTDTSRPDYLTFEEGFATTIEEVVSSEKPEWEEQNLSYYVNIALARDGADFRSVFETTWRYYLLMSIGDNVEVTDRMIDKQKNRAYNVCVRIFRGVQPDINDKTSIKPMTFNKDLAYLEGRMLAMNYIEELYVSKDADSLDRTFMAHYDPTNDVQDKIVRTALGDVI